MTYFSKTKVSPREEQEAYVTTRNETNYHIDRTKEGIEATAFKFKKTKASPWNGRNIAIVSTLALIGLGLIVSGVVVRVLQDPSATSTALMASGGGVLLLDGAILVFILCKKSDSKKSVSTRPAAVVENSSDYSYPIDTQDSDYESFLARQQKQQQVQEQYHVTASGMAQKYGLQDRTRQSSVSGSQPAPQSRSSASSSRQQPAPATKEKEKSALEQIVDAKKEIEADLDNLIEKWNEIKSNPDIQGQKWTYASIAAQAGAKAEDVEMLAGLFLKKAGLNPNQKSFTTQDISKLISYIEKNKTSVVKQLAQKGSKKEGKAAQVGVFFHNLFG